jgi:hypothetical protein
MSRNHTRLQPHRAPTGRLRGLVAGALGGLGVAVVCLAVGLMRAAFVLLGGTHVTWPSPEDIRPIALYVGGFVVAGAVAGVVGVERGRRARGYVVFMFGGAAVMLAIALADKGSVRAMDGVDAGAVVVLGPLFGAAFARGWYRGP